MKTYSTEPLEQFETDRQGLYIHIRWNEEIVQFPNQRHDGFINLYCYNEAVIQQGDSRSTIIEKIMGSSYTTGAEFAAINNKDVDPEEYAAYQAYRANAKYLADLYLGLL